VASRTLPCPDDSEAAGADFLEQFVRADLVAGALRNWRLQVAGCRGHIERRVKQAVVNPVGGQQSLHPLA
jgi:hypothetical protein